MTWLRSHRVLALLGPVVFALAVTGVGVGAPASSVGVVDIVTVTILHPDMAWFDFSRLGFVRDPRLAGVASAPAPEVIAGELAALATQAVDADASRAVLLRQPMTGQPTQAIARNREIARLHALGEAIRGQRRRLLSIQANPDLTSPDETQRLLARVASDALEAVRCVAAGAGVDVVLNRSVTLPPAADQSGDHDPGVVGLPWLQQSILRALLAAPADEGEVPAIPDARSLHTWLAVTRTPGVQRGLRLRPHPLVLMGGRDLTVAAVACLLARHGIATATIEAIRSQLACENERPAPLGAP